MAKLRIKLMFNGEPTGRELSAEASSPEGLWNVITRKLPRDAGWGYRIHVSTAGALEMGAYESNGDVDGTMTVLVPGHEYVTVYIDSDLTDAARALGAKGGAAGRGAAKRRDVDYSALGKLGGRPRKSCEVCGSHPAYRKGLCVACQHAIEVHGATRADAHMVTCDRKRCGK